MFWWAQWESNPRPSGYEPPALTAELQAPIYKCMIPYYSLSLKVLLSIHIN